MNQQVANMSANLSVANEWRKKLTICANLLEAPHKQKPSVFYRFQQWPLLKDKTALKSFSENFLIRMRMSSLKTTGPITVSFYFVAIQFNEIETVEVLSYNHSRETRMA